MEIYFHNTKYNHLRELMHKIMTPKRNAEESLDDVAAKQSRTEDTAPESVGDDPAEVLSEHAEHTEGKKRRRRHKHGENSSRQLDTQPESQPALPVQPVDVAPAMSALPASSSDGAFADTLVHVEAEIQHSFPIFDKDGFRRSRSDDRHEGSYRSRSRVYDISKEEKEFEAKELRRWFQVTKGGLLPDNEDSNCLYVQTLHEVI